jgi:hypothetical protein
VTLVAAYRNQGLPVLLGDFMVSGSDGRRRGRKKISRPRENMVLGWTGNLLQAEQCMAKLLADLGKRPTRDELEEGLSQLRPDPGLGGVKLVGWLGPSPLSHGFQWDSSAEIVTWGQEWFVGSGGSSFELSFKAFRDPLDGEIEPDGKLATEQLCRLLTILNCGDRMTQQGNAYGFGGGYEALLWSNQTAQFQYVGPQLFFVVLARIGMDGSLEEPPTLLNDSLTRYEGGIAGDSSVLTFSVGEGHETWAMSPAGGPDDRGDLLSYLRSDLDEPMDLGAEFYGGMLGFVSPNPCPAVPLVVCPWDPKPICRGHRGRFDLTIPTEAIEIAYRERRALLAQQPIDLIHIPADRHR